LSIEISLQEANVVKRVRANRRKSQVPRKHSRGETGNSAMPCAIISEDIYVRAQSFLRKIET
jgi:hypothetical protein